MRYLNFKLASSKHAIEIVAPGLNWDLHNFADFVGLRLAPDADAVLTRVVPDTTNGWGDSNNHYRGCELWFREVRRFEIISPKNEMPISENRTLAEISELDQDGRDYRQTTSPSDSPFCLFIKFNGGLSMKVDAAAAELRPLKDELAA
jgi:hypothetical protein